MPSHISKNGPYKIAMSGIIAVTILAFPLCEQDTFYETMQSEVIPRLQTLTFFPISDSGQEVSYYPGDDASYRSSSQMYYTNNGDGTVTDARSGLTWTLCTLDENGEASATCTGTKGKFSWQDAIDKCNALSLASKGWHLPTVAEMASLVDYSRTNPAINPVFADTSCYDCSTESDTLQIMFCTASPWVNSTAHTERYWTSTQWLDKDMAWAFHFYDGHSNPGYERSNLFYARCVTDD